MQRNHYGIRADGSKRYLSTSPALGQNLIESVRRLQAILAEQPTPGLTWVVPTVTLGDAPTVPTTTIVQRWRRDAFLGFLYGALGVSLVGLVALAYLGVVTALAAS